jgi:hypothetical protein
MRNLSAFGVPIPGGGTDSAPRRPVASAGTPLIAPTTRAGDAPPLVPNVVPSSGAFSPPQPILSARKAPTAPFTEPPLRTIKLPTSAELIAQINAMAGRGASAAELRPITEKLLRAKAREAALKVPGLPGVQPGTVPKDDSGKRPTTGPGPGPRLPTGGPGPQPPVVIPIPIPGVPSADTAATKPASDVVDKAGSAVGGRVVKDLLTFALLTSPAWLTILLFPRRP